MMGVVEKGEVCVCVYVSCLVSLLLELYYRNCCALGGCNVVCNREGGGKLLSLGLKVLQ